MLAAHATRASSFAQKKLGSFSSHLGVILLLLGQLLTGLFARETQMRIDEGQTLGYSEAPREVELAVIDATDPNFDQVVAIPEKILASAHDSKPDAAVYTSRSSAFSRMRASRCAWRNRKPPPTLATTGFGANIVAAEASATVKDDERDLSAAFVGIDGVQGSLGTWLVSNAIPDPQSFTVNGHTYELVMRQRRAPTAADDTSCRRIEGGRLVRGRVVVRGFPTARSARCWWSGSDSIRPRRS